MSKIRDIMASRRVTIISKNPVAELNILALNNIEVRGNWIDVEGRQNLRAAMI
jgi:hypothetical protein